MQRPLLLALVVLAAVLPASAARADVTSPGPVFMPAPLALTLHPLFGEPTGPSAALFPPLAVLPARLSMLSSAFPLAGHVAGRPRCAARPTRAATRSTGSPSSIRLYLAMTSQLAVHGFSRLGCPLDAVAGGAVTYAAPLARDVSIVASSAATTTSSVNGHVRTRAEVRLDLLT